MNEVNLGMEGLSKDEVFLVMEHRLKEVKDTLNQPMPFGQVVTIWKFNLAFEELKKRLKYYENLVIVKENHPELLENSDKLV